MDTLFAEGDGELATFGIVFLLGALDPLLTISSFALSACCFSLSVAGFRLIVGVGVTCECFEPVFLLRCSIAAPTNTTASSSKTMRTLFVVFLKNVFFVVACRLFFIKLLDSYYNIL